MKKIGVFGGRFDPIHTGHLIVALDALEILGLSKIYFLVSYNAPHKESVAGFEDRLEMARLATEGSPEFEVLDIERKLSLEKSYTYLVMKRLREELGAHREYYLLVGADQFNQLRTWYEYRKLAESTYIAVLRRPHQDVDESILEELGDRVVILRSRLIEISGTEIRSKVKNGKPIRYLVPPSVATYIEKKGLYRD